MALIDGLISSFEASSLFRIFSIVSASAFSATKA